MKDLTMLVWLSQLGLSVACPLALFLLLALWLRNGLGWGDWVIWAGLALGIITAVSGFRNALRLMDRTTREGKKKAPPPPSFNDHF